MQVAAKFNKAEDGAAKKWIPYAMELELLTPAPPASPPANTNTNASGNAKASANVGAGAGSANANASSANNTSGMGSNIHSSNLKFQISSPLTQVLNGSRVNSAVPH